MPRRLLFTSSIWFVTLVALLAALGAQVLIGALMPLAAFNWLHDELPKGPVVLIAGQTSFWREDTIVRAVSFGIGAFIACLLARSHSWRLHMSLAAAALLATAFAQFPRSATLTQITIWSCAAPAATILVSFIFSMLKSDA